MKASRTMIFILSVILLLGFLSWVFPKEGIELFGRKFYFASLEEILAGQEASVSVEEQLEALEAQMRMKQEQDSIEQQRADSLAFYTRFFDSHPSRFHLPQNDYNFFFDLFASFDQCHEQGEVVHILHYGDSQIEGDRLSSFLRQRLQERFGGQGAGLLPAVQVIESPTVSHSSEGLERFTVSGMHANTSGHRRYGIMGQMGKSYGSASLTIGSRNWKNTPEGVKEYTKVRLYVGQTGDFTPSLAAGGQTKPITNKSGDNRLAVYSWEMDTPVKRVALRMQGQAEVYGVSLEGSSGIALDNIPFRGSSGTFFSSLDSTLMRTMAESLRVGLVIVQFGGNTLPYAKTTKAIQHYKTQMSRQIDFLRRTMPMAKIVLIGPSDMSTKVDGRLQTYPQMEEFVEALRQAANENGAAFWSIYDAMGGKNSMINWVKNSPPMAAPDYIHFNERGVNRIASLFFESLMLYYDYYASGELRIES